MSNQTINVFVSYSHTDSRLVAPVVKLLRANRSFVFQDIDSIQPGKKWRSEIERGLVDSDLVVVFWCDHASRSDEVCKEWKTAVEHEKDLLPLLLDATPLPPELGDFQWIDFRATVGANHASIVSPLDDSVQAKLAPPSKSSRWLLFGGLAAVSAAGVTGGLLFTAKLPTEDSVPPTFSSPPGVFDKFFIAENLVLLVLLLAVTGLFVWLFLQWLWKARSSLEVTPPDISQIAQEIEEEILRRKTLKDGAVA